MSDFNMFHGERVKYKGQHPLLQDQKGKVVDARVDAHTLDAAKRMFLRQFPMHEIVKCTRIKSYIEKKGGINAL